MGGAAADVLDDGGLSAVVARAVAARAGVSPSRAADGIHALTAYVHGHLVCSVPDGADETVGRALRGIDPADYPLTATARASGDDLPGFDVVLDGLPPLR